jgi:HPt (histidine-containing phosphotransfer) domain-containing protein
MADSPIIERVDPDLEVLMERFFISSKVDLEKMQSAFEARDFSTLVRLGHTAKGAGYGYGCMGMGDIGAELESVAKSEDEAEVRILIDKMEYYLDNVKIEFGK